MIMKCFEVRILRGVKFVCEGELIPSTYADKAGLSRTYHVCARCRTRYNQPLRSEKAALLLELARKEVLKN